MNIIRQWLKGINFNKKDLLKLLISNNNKKEFKNKKRFKIYFNNFIKY